MHVVIHKCNCAYSCYVAWMNRVLTSALGANGEWNSVVLYKTTSYSSDPLVAMATSAQLRRTNWFGDSIQDNGFKCRTHTACSWPVGLALFRRSPKAFWPGPASIGRPNVYLPIYLFYLVSTYAV